VLLAACTGAQVADQPSSESSSNPTPIGDDATPEETAAPSASIAPPSLYGTWRTTYVGEEITLTISATNYVTKHGSELAARGMVRVTGDEIEFSEGTRCSGKGTYRWQITDGFLTLFVLEEECEGRADGFRLRWGDYSPPDDD
jgi:hypothetical protein